MSGISAIYILDNKKRILISREYRGDLNEGISEIFSKKLLEQDENLSAPIIIIEEMKLSFFYKKINNIYIVLGSKTNSNCLMMLSYLQKLSEVLLDYFTDLEEESIRDNFATIYELLDEMMDNGYPQTTESKVMSEFIKTEKLELNTKAINKKQAEFSQTLTNVVSWRQPGLYYKKNNVYLDVIESVNMQISHNGNVVSSEILGCMMMKTQLSGMPELKLGINDKLLYELQGRDNNKKSIELNDLKFHSCVRLSKFENERVISFIPPDGEFQLMSYRLEISVKPLIMVTCEITNWKNTRIDFSIKAKSNFKQKCIANNVKICIPLPSDIFQTKFESQEGKAEYDSCFEGIAWNINQLPGHKEIAMTVTGHLPSVKSNERDKFLQRPIELHFEIPYFTVSGMLIRYLKVEEKSGYHASPFVRYISKNGNYYIRTNNQKPLVIQ